VASAGCVFKNPPGEAAGRLIDEAGLRGYAEGNAQVSEVHANFIVNRGGARAEDVRRLIGIVAERVKARFGVPLSLELQILSSCP
jgi:UDP-N-acetylmuramate dehydrogenase